MSRLICVVFVVGCVCTIIFVQVLTLSTLGKHRVSLGAQCTVAADSGSCIMLQERGTGQVTG